MVSLHAATVDRQLRRSLCDWQVSGIYSVETQDQERFPFWWTQGDSLRFLPVIQNIMQFKAIIVYINLLSDNLIFFGCGCLSVVEKRESKTMDGGGMTACLI